MCVNIWSIIIDDRAIDEAKKRDAVLKVEIKLISVEYRRTVMAKGASVPELTGRRSVKTGLLSRVSLVYGKNICCYIYVVILAISYFSTCYTLAVGRGDTVWPFLAQRMPDIGSIHVDNRKAFAYTA